VLPANEMPTIGKISDAIIWQYAKDNDYQLVTFDEDFVELQNLQGYPPKIIWLRMGNVSTQEIANRLTQLEATLTKFITDKDSGVLEIY
jgi:predicted nuclease of predicted toxin-antitoxin system